jgi:hypothetical protein
VHRFAVGDRVSIRDRRGVTIGVQMVIVCDPSLIATNCGRSWTLDGQWFDGQQAWPFPSIRPWSESTRQDMAHDGEDGDAPRYAGTFGLALQMLFCSTRGARVAGSSAVDTGCSGRSISKALAMLLAP